MALSGKRWQVSSLRHKHYKCGITSQKNTLGMGYKVKRRKQVLYSSWVLHMARGVSSVL